MDSERYESVRSRVQRALARELENVHYVLAVWEIEAWLLLFPEEIAGFTTGWQVPAKRRGRDTGKFPDPKRIFTDEISTAGTRYRESDGPAVANHVASLASTPLRLAQSVLRFPRLTPLCRKLSDSGPPVLADDPD